MGTQTRSETYQGAKEIHGADLNDNTPGHIGLIGTAERRCPTKILVDFMSKTKLLHVEVKFMHRIHQRNLGQSLVHDVGVSKRVLKGKNAYFIKWKGY